MAKMTRKGREFVSDEISHLMKEGPSKGPQKGKKMPQKQAVAVALDVARRKGLKTPPNPNESYGFGSGTRSSFDFAEGRIARFKLVKAAVYRKYPGLKEAFGSGHHSTEVLPLKKPKFKSLDEKPPYHVTTEVLPKPVEPKPPTNPSSEEMNMSMFDSIIENNRPKSLFDAIVVGGGKSRFDDIVEANKAPAKSMFDDIIESKNGPAAADWDDRVARTLNLTEELVGIRDRART